MTPSVHRAFALVATIVVVASVAWGFVVVGTPDTRRQQRLDERRLDDLRAIHQEIQELVRDRDRSDALRAPLPRNLIELTSRAKRRKLRVADPVTEEPYGYRVLSDTRYELSATFTLPRDASRGVFWNHPAGRCAFEVDALDPP